MAKKTPTPPQPSVPDELFVHVRLLEPVYIMGRKYGTERHHAFSADDAAQVVADGKGWYVNADGSAKAI